MTKKYELNEMELELVAGGQQRNKTEKKQNGFIKLVGKTIIKVIGILISK